MSKQRATVWVCGACGKRSNDQFGTDPIDGGWDESCMLNAVLAYTDSLVIDGWRVAEIKDGGVVSDPRKPLDMSSIYRASTASLDDLDPELLELAGKALERLGEKATSVSASAQQSVRPDDTQDDTTPAAQPAGRTGEHE